MRPVPGGHAELPASSFETRAARAPQSLTENEALQSSHIYRLSPRAAQHEVLHRRRGVQILLELMDPGSAAHRFTLRCARDTSPRKSEFIFGQTLRMRLCPQ